MESTININNQAVYALSKSVLWFPRTITIIKYVRHSLTNQNTQMYKCMHMSNQFK